MASKSKNNDQPKSYSAPALEKGLDVLELLAEKQVPMSMPQISAALNRSKSEIYRMVTVLEERGYLHRTEGSDQYRITNRLFDLGMSVSPVGTLVEDAYPLMYELSESIGQSSHLVVASGDRIVIVARVESSAVFGFSVKVGRCAGLFETTSGIVLLAWMPETERNQLIESHLRKNPGFDAEKIEITLKTVRGRGWLQRKSADVSGITDISVPIFLGDGDYAIASLMVPFLVSSSTKIAFDDTAQLVRDTSRKISALAGRHQGF